MANYVLKEYQKKSLSILEDFLGNSRIIGAEDAFKKLEIAGNKKYFKLPKEIGDVPYCCLRLPTGGGKTLLSAASIKIACNNYIEKDFPIVLWLVPSNTIRSQTLETLKNPDNANYQTLYDAFGSNFMAIDIADFTQIRAHEIGNKAIIIVATIQTLKVNSNNIDARKVYAHNENLEPHFAKIPNNFTGFDVIEAGRNDAGTIRFSFANLLRMHRPLVLVDEAHNNSTKLAFETLERINPECIIEFTATPASNSNIIHKVSAAELKEEEMVKLPIVLTEHVTWEAAVHDSIRTRAKLEEDAKQEREYIRPIVLFQAESKGNDLIWEKLRNHLIENENIEENKIAVVTGEQRELDGINLFDKNCPIEFVITVQALKEGWDCSFAYVFCSLANINSAKDVEQLLGRVLRMPYARRRQNENLNKAYAHVCKTSWPNAVDKLTDKLVHGMGFEEQEAEENIEYAPKLNLAGGSYGGSIAPVEVPISIEFNISDLPEGEKQAIRFEKRDGGLIAIISGQISPKIQEVIFSLVPKDEKWAEKTLKQQQYEYSKRNAPVAKGQKFKVPQLVFDYFDNYIEPDDESLLYYGNWQIDNGFDLSPSEFSINEEGITFEIDIKGEHIKHQFVGRSQGDLDNVDIGWDIPQLARWLTIRLQRQDLSFAELVSCNRNTLEKLVEKRGLQLSSIVKFRFILAKVIENKIKDSRKTAKEHGYQVALFEDKAKPVADSMKMFSFEANTYFPRETYKGRHIFSKHFYGMTIGKMNSEEVDCAIALEQNDKIKYFVRNLESDANAFRIATKTGYMYPDFVALLHDGRTLVVEYKGEDRDNSDTEHKEDVGKLWEKKTNGKGKFIIGWKNMNNLSISQQIERAINN